MSSRAVLPSPVFLLAVALVAWQAPGFIRLLTPPSTVTYDFYQDWASARNVLSDEPIYADISLTIERYLGWRLPDNWPAQYWRRNFHPPPAVLLTLPFAWLNYPDAFLLWSLLSLAALVATVWLLARQSAVKVSVHSTFVVTALLLLWYPFQQQVMQGQVNLLLLLMLTTTWAANRSARPLTAGVVLGVATAVKLFPGLLLVYFALRREWKVTLSCFASVIVVNAFSAIVFGTEAYSTYLNEVLPASDQWLSHWHNVSLMALWTKLFNPGPAGGNIIPAWHSPFIARLGGYVSCGVVLSLVLWATRRAKSDRDHDRTFGLTVTAMLLVSPITWSQNLVLLIFPVSLLWLHRIELGTVHRWTLIAIILALFIPPHWVWQLLIPRGWPDGTAGPWQTVAALSFQTFAVLGFLVVQLLWSIHDPRARHSVH